MERTQPQMLQQLIEGLTQAEGACSQIIHQHEDPRWMMIRQALSLTKEGCFLRATFEAKKTIVTSVG